MKTIGRAYIDGAPLHSYILIKKKGLYFFAPRDLRSRQKYSLFYFYKNKHMFENTLHFCYTNCRNSSFYNSCEI